MRFIKKGELPTFFEEWKDKYRIDHSVEPTYRDLIGPTKQSLKQYLINEQKGLCCYCCKKLIRKYSHIEHIKPQSIFKDEDLDYNNMVVSCNGIKDKNENCGHKKALQNQSASRVDGNCSNENGYPRDI